MNDKDLLLPPPPPSSSQQPPLLRPSRYKRAPTTKAVPTQAHTTVTSYSTKAGQIASKIHASRTTTQSPSLTNHSIVKASLPQCPTHVINRNSAGSNASLPSKMTDLSTASTNHVPRSLTDHQRMRSTGTVPHLPDPSVQAARMHFTSRSSEISSSVRRNAGRPHVSSSSVADSSSSSSQKSKAQFHFMRPVGPAHTITTRRREQDASLPVRPRCTAKHAPPAKQPHKHKVQTLKAAVAYRQPTTHTTGQRLVHGRQETSVKGGESHHAWSRDKTAATDHLRRPNWPPKPLLSQRGTAIAAATLATSRLSRAPPLRSSSRSNHITETAVDNSSLLQNRKRLDMLPEQESCPEDLDEHSSDEVECVALTQPPIEHAARPSHSRRPKRPSLGDGWTKRAQYLLDMTARRKASILESSPSIPSSPATRSEDNDIDTSPFLLKKNETTTPVPMPSQADPQSHEPTLPQVPSTAQGVTTSRRLSDGRDLISSLAKSDSDLRDIHQIMSNFLQEHDCSASISQGSRKVSPLQTRATSLASQDTTNNNNTVYMNPAEGGPARLHSASSRRQSSSRMQWRPHTPAAGHLSSPIICLNLHTPPFNTASSRRLMLSSDPKAPIRKPVSRRVLLSGLLCKSAATVESAIVELNDDPNTMLPIPFKYKHKFQSPYSDLPCTRASALFLAVKISSPQVVSKLLDLGAVVNTLDDWNRNALHLTFLPRPSEMHCCLQQMKGLPRRSPPPCPSIIREECTLLEASVTSGPDISRRSSLVTPRIISHSLLTRQPPCLLESDPSISAEESATAQNGSGGAVAELDLKSLTPQQAEELCFMAFTEDADALSRSIELLCLRGCDIEARDTLGRTPIDYAREWLTVLSRARNSPTVSGARAAALTLLAFEDRLRLKLLAPLTTNLSIRAYRPYKFIQIVLPSNADTTDVVQFTPHIQRTCYNGADGTIERTRRISAASCVSLDTRVRSNNGEYSVGKNATSRRTSCIKAVNRHAEGCSSLRRRKTKSGSLTDSTPSDEKFNLKGFVDLVHQRSFSHPGLLGIWEFLGAKFQVEAKAE